MNIKHSPDKKEYEMGLLRFINGVECAPIGGQLDKNLLINKNLAKVVEF